MKKNSKSSLIPLYFIIASVVIGLVYFISVYLQDFEKTVPKIKLSYFQSPTELAEAITDRLELELRNENQFWIGVEPQKQDHLEFAEQLIQLLKNQNKITQIFIDEQLGLKQNQLAAFASSFPEFKIYPIKDKWFELAYLYKKHMMDNTAVITAAVYSTSMLAENPIFKIKKEAPEIKPTTFSTGYFAVDTEDEKNNIFPCFTEDKTGTNRWACAVINKARTQRRKLKSTGEIPSKHTIGLMDLTGEKDYMILFKQR